LDGVSPLLGTNYLSSLNFNRELQQLYGLAASSSQPHEIPSSTNRTGWVANGFGPSGSVGEGLTEAGGWFDKRSYRVFLERCYQAGITGVSGGFNLTGSYSVNVGGNIVSVAESFLNQQDMIKARIEFSLKQAQQIYNNVFYFDNLNTREFYLTPWLTEPETEGSGSPTGAGYTLSSTTPSQKPWPRIYYSDSNYPLFQMGYTGGVARGLTSVLHRPSEYDYFTIVRKMVWRYGAGPFFIFDARGLIYKPLYTQGGSAGTTGISGAITWFAQKDRYSHTSINTYLPEANFVGIPSDYGYNPVYASFGSNAQTGNSPVTIVFDSSDSWNPGGTATWYFNGTTTGPSAQGITASYQYVGAGSYTVRLDIANAYDSDTLTRTNYIVVSQEGVTGTANVIGSPLTGTAPTIVTFTDSSTIVPTDYATTYNSVVISFGDGTTASMLSGQSLISVTHSYDTSGDYTVTYSMVWNSGLTSYISKSNYISITDPSPTGGETGSNFPVIGGANSVDFRFVKNPSRLKNGKVINNFGRFDIIK
jgi:PKD repeat protein